RNPFQLVVQIIDHTTRGMFDHPFFREASIGPRDTIMIEEAENAIMVHVRGSQGYQKVPCAALFIIPEDLKPFLDEVVTMWSHFFGKEYDIACFYEREVFEKLEDLKERAKPLNRLFGGMIRAFDDAIDVARAEYARSLERFTDTRTEQEPLLEEEIPDIKPLPAKTIHGISQPFFPPPSLEQVYEELQPSEQRLMEMDPQFDEMVQELLSDLRSMLRGEKPRQTTHFADRLPEPTEQEHQGLDRIYRQLVPGSILHLLNPRTFLL